MNVGKYHHYRQIQCIMLVYTNKMAAHYLYFSNNTFKLDIVYIKTKT
jgi:hypothetical protein